MHGEGVHGGGGEGDEEGCIGKGVRGQGKCAWGDGVHGEVGRL